MIESEKHQLDDLSVTDILSYLNARVSSMEEDIRRKRKQLTKAKEIIKGLLSCCRNYPQENAEKMERAEQFLNSGVKE